jgi:hypothetical protein
MDTVAAVDSLGWWVVADLQTVWCEAENKLSKNKDLLSFPSLLRLPLSGRIKLSSAVAFLGLFQQKWRQKGPRV